MDILELKKHSSWNKSPVNRQKKKKKEPQESVLSITKDLAFESSEF